MADTMIYIPSASVGMTALDPGEYFFIPTEVITLTPLNPAGVVGLPAEALATARTVFRCILTGDENELNDLVIPIASFSATVREGDPTYLSCKIPVGSVYEDEILLRTDGDIVVKSGVVLTDGTEYLEEIVRVNYEDMHIERTDKMDTLVITGHKTRTLGQSKDWTLSGVSYLSLDTAGKRRIRGNVDFQLRCGDICTYGDGIGESLIVGTISYAVAARPAMAFMEIEEA